MGAAEPCLIPDFGNDTYVGETPATNATHFRWSAERYLMPGSPHVEETRHTIENLHVLNLAFDWQKVGFGRAFSDPLTPGQRTDCSLDQGSFRPDNDAPITTSNDGAKNAIAFVAAGRATDTEGVDGAAAEGAGAITSGAQVIVGSEGLRAGLLLQWFPADKVLDLTLFPGAAGYEVAVSPAMIGIPTEVFLSSIDGRDVAIVTVGTFSELAQDAEVAGIPPDILESILFVRVMAREPIGLRYVDVREMPARATPILIFGPEGALRYIKRLSMSAFAPLN
jgi:hypothetical protein